jgi:predicted helicase
LAHTGMVEIEVDGHAKGKTVKVKQQVHKVQLLDVATGTGTFLAEVVKQIYARFKNQKGAWSSYVDQHLLPRMHGFELLMAPYAMCHMKLELLLKETGYTPSNPANPPRVSVYLTNSLEEHHPDTGTLFAQWLSQEANAASRIKKDIPIMVALGNPPYSGISSNMKSWIAQNKIEDYKYVNGVHFNERKHWLNDDYVQFIRLGEHYIEKNGEGILAYITNHGYLDNPTCRGMRWHLLNTFDDIYVLDLHGNAKKKETAPDGSPDKNVFDIQQGVAIIVAIKRLQKDKKKPLAKVYHADLWGAREPKYEALDTGRLTTMPFKVLDVRDPFYFFIRQNYDDSAEYQAGFAVNEIFADGTTGIQTSRDTLVVDFTKQGLVEKIKGFCDPTRSVSQVRNEFFGSKKVADYPSGDTRGWRLDAARNKIQSFDHATIVADICYRPFDERAIYYSPEMIDWPRTEVMSNFIKCNNLGIIIGRQGQVVGPMEWNLAFISRSVTDLNVFYRGGGLTFPLWIYGDMLGGVESKRPNLDPKIYKAIQKIVPDIQPQSLFDYIYAVLHSRSYRQRYAEFLKSNFPRIPYPKDKKTFHALAAKGAELRGLHLMESPALDNLITTYSIGGTHKIVAARWEDAKGKTRLGRVWINPTQYFDNVPLTAWEFYIGGYQPAQKWLKDRKGRKLTSDDLLHWQRIIAALTETDKVMCEIDKIDFLPK